ncbi:retrovirus-related pol polyprotein from transposon TNT 1-94 [Tanacetum coccineum]
MFGNNSRNNTEENAFANDNNNTNNATNNVINIEDFSQLIDSKGGSHVTNVPQLYVEDLSSWKDRTMTQMLKKTLRAHNKDAHRDQKDYNARYKYIKADLALLTQKIVSSSKKKNEKGLVVESYDWDEESLSSRDEGTIKAFMAISDDEPSMGKYDARYGQWVKITMKKVHILISMNDGDERKHVLDYTMVDLHYVEDQSKNLLSKSSSFKQEMSSSNESLKDEVTDLKERNSRRYGLDLAKIFDIGTREDKKISFWGEAVNTAYYTQKRSVIVKRHGKTSYHIFRGRPLDVSYFDVFGCLVFIHNHRDHLGKFDERADDEFFLRHSLVYKAFMVFNIRRQELKETFHVTFNEVDEVIRQNGLEAHDINFNENMSFLDNEFSVPRNPNSQYHRSDEFIPYVPPFDPLLTYNITIFLDHITPSTKIIILTFELPNSQVDDDHLIAT